MKVWSIPQAVGQQFAANEYVSACTIEAKCDFRTGEQLRGGGLVVPEGVDGGFAGGEYRPCDEEFQVGVHQLKEVTFTHYTSGPDNEPLSKSYTTYYWVQTYEDGTTDFHAVSVTPDQLAAANMS